MRKPRDNRRAISRWTGALQEGNVLTLPGRGVLTWSRQLGASASAHDSGRSLTLNDFWAFRGDSESAPRSIALSTSEGPFTHRGGIARRRTPDSARSTLLFLPTPPGVTPRTFLLGASRRGRRADSSERVARRRVAPLTPLEWPRPRCFLQLGLTTSVADCDGRGHSTFSLSAPRSAASQHSPAVAWPRTMR